MPITFASSYHCLNDGVKQSKIWATCYEVATGSYSYQDIFKEYDELEELLQNYNKEYTECVRHISGLWFSIKKNKSGYSLILRQE